MDECLQIIDERDECPNDKILVEQVRLQLVVEKASLNMSYDGVLGTSEHEGSLSLHFEGLHSRLQCLQGRLLSDFHHNGKMTCVKGVKRSGGL